MIPPIVSSPRPITLIGGAQVAPATLSDGLRHGETVVCADGGAETALAAGLEPAAVIGDMDSISEAARAAFGDVLHEVAEQDSTDFDKALRHIETPLVVAVGFLGDRVDHSLAALHVLLKYRERRVILLGDDDVIVLCPARLRLGVPVGTRVSLMPFPDARVDTTGLRWEVRDAEMTVERFIGTSNEAVADQVEIRAGGGLLVILPRGELDAVVRAVTGDVPAG